MASDATGTRSVYNTLSGTTVDTVTLQGHWSAVEVINLDGTDVLWVTVGKAGDTLDAPVASANETFTVPANTSLVIEIANGAQVQPQVKVLGDGGAYGVIGHPSAATNRNKNA